MTGPMKIERIRTYHLRAELTPAEAFAYSQARVGFRTAMLVEIVADDGRSGWGEAYGPPAPSKTIIDELYPPRLIGRDPMATTAICEDLYPSPPHHASGAMTALRLGRLIEPLDIAWFEEPVPPEDLDGYLQVKRALTMPISGGEAEYARFGFRDLVARRCVDILQPDICAGGGFTEALRIGALANTWGVTVYPHVWGSAVGLHASMQWAASLPPNPFALVPGELWFELDRTANPFRESLAAEPLKRAGAIIDAPQRPGLGIEVDRAM